jgi:uncharacterized protein (TIGR02996 family)
MNLEQAFLEAIVASPADFTPRLIFMDWLDEHSDLRGELLRLLHTLTQEIAPPDRPALEARLRGLLENGVQPVGPFWTNASGLKFAWITPGRLLMGSPASELAHQDDETQHEVTLTKGYYLGVHPVTQAQWQEVMGNTPSHFQGENLPVEQVSWNDCQEFLKKLRDQDGQAYRLPTEAEWEYACRAGTTTPFHFGAVLNGQQANCDGNYPYNTDAKGPYLERTTAVGSYAANAWGLHDMHGNVWQWCEDDYVPTYYANSPIKDPLNVNKPRLARRVLRGGSWYLNPTYCRAARRLGYAPEDRRDNSGFRVCLSLD